MTRVSRLKEEHTHTHTHSQYIPLFRHCFHFIFFLICYVLFVNVSNHVLVENIFTQQPSYYSDLDETVPTVLQVRSGKFNSNEKHHIVQKKVM